VPPLLVLGLGNLLLGDDGVGLRLLEELARDASARDARIELLDGGTQGLALLGRIEGRRALLILDAVALGAAPGTVHVLDGAQAMRAGGPPGESAGTAPAHEGGASQLLAYSGLLGDLPKRILVVGVEPRRVTTGIGLSPDVERAVPAAAAQARAAIRELLQESDRGTSCTN
jgi:hydrogenase maturation protease